MAPVLALNAIPLGMDGLISHVVTLPPLMAGVVVAMSVAFSSVTSCEEETLLVGAPSLTVMFRYASAEPPELLAQIVYWVRDKREVGVPSMVPVAVLKVNAEPGDGEISHEVMVPPLVVGLMLGLIATFFVSVISVVEYDITGITSLTVMLTSAEAEPPELLAQTV